MNRPSLEIANKALVKARGLRAQTLLAIEAGYVTVWDVCLQVATSPKTPIGRITLRQLITCQVGKGAHAAKQIERRLLTNLGAKTPKRLDVDWLTDPRVKGARLIALADALNEETTQPWLGYPFTPPRRALYTTASNWSPH